MDIISPDRSFVIDVPGATPEELARALVAAQAVFARYHVTPRRAAEAAWTVEGWDINGFVDEIDEDELTYREAWYEADRAARDACCAGWDASRRPPSAGLELLE